MRERSQAAGVHALVPRCVRPAWPLLLEGSSPPTARGCCVLGVPALCSLHQAREDCFQQWGHCRGPLRGSSPREAWAPIRVSVGGLLLSLPESPSPRGSRAQRQARLRKPERGPTKGKGHLQGAVSTPSHPRGLGCCRRSTRHLVSCVATGAPALLCSAAGRVDFFVSERHVK